MKYFFIAGERSGDRHASEVIRHLITQDNEASIVAWGGHYMEAAGAKLLKNYKDFSVMGFWEVLTNLSEIRKHIHLCQAAIETEKPDVLVLIDYPGFNLKMATFAHQLGIKACYFISPKIWAWGSSRIKKIKSSVDRMLVILPFEKDYYQRFNYEVQYVGNPLVEQIQSYTFDKKLINKLKSEGKKIAMLPGSRIQEIIPALRVIRKLAAIYDDYEFLVAGVDNVDRSLYSSLDEYENVRLFFDKTYELLRAADVAIVTSGTATLEAALLDVPQVVVYKTSWVSYWIARLLVRVRYISLVNIIAGRQVVKELIQGDYNAVDISTQLESLLYDSGTKKRISEGYSEIRESIGHEQTSINAAKAIYALGCL